MFSYSLPSWKKKINTRAFSIVTILIYVLTVLPLLILGHFNYPSADDFSLPYQTHVYLEQTGNVIGAFFSSFQVGFDEYMNWMGYYFSNVVFCYCPIIFGENWYFLVAYIMIGILTLGVCYFFNALFVKGLKLDKNLSTAVSMITLTIAVLSMENGTVRVESFYWYTGAVNYMFMLGMGFFWLGLMIRAVFDEKRSSRIGKFVWAVFWGFWLGGANYMTALEVAICSALVIIICVLAKIGFVRIEGVDEGQRKAFNIIWIPAAVNLIGFMLSCFAPGNATREAKLQGVGPIKAIFTSMYHTYDMCISDFSRWEVIVAFVLLVPVCFKLAEGCKHRFEHPFIFAVFSFGMVSANIVPPIYAMGSLEAGRLRSIIWVEYVVMMALTIFYFSAWARQRLEMKDSGMDSFSAPSSMVILTCALFILFGSVLCVHVDHYYYTTSSAVYDLATGNASRYLEENKARLQVLEDPSVTDAVFEPYSVQPEMLVFCDITTNEKDWKNKATARYYGKNTVVLGEQK